MIFTDENGEKYELAGGEADLTVPSSVARLVIKPIKKIKTYHLAFDIEDGQLMEAGILWRELNLTETQAQAIPEAIEALVEYAAADNGSLDYKGLINLIGNARKALQDAS